MKIFACVFFVILSSSVQLFANDASSNVFEVSDSVMENSYFANEKVFDRCFDVQVSCWPEAQWTCFDDSYTLDEIIQLVLAMEGAWCDEDVDPGN